MVSSCCIVNCKNHRIRTKSLHLRYYRIPKSDKQRRAKWLEAIGRSGWQPSPFSRVCSDHFVFGEKSDNTLSPNYVPCIFNDTTLAEKKRLQRLFDIHSKQIAETTKKINATTVLLSVVEEDLASLLQSSHVGCGFQHAYADFFENEEEEEPDLRPEMLYVDGCFVDPKKQFCVEENDISTEEIEKRVLNYPKKKPSLRTEKCTQTSIAHDYIKSLEEECSNLRRELVNFQGKIVFRDIKLETLYNAEDKIKYLTGLESYGMLKVLAETISSYQSKTFKLTGFQQLLLTLMKMRLNIPFPFLAIMFDIDALVVLQLFIHTIDLLFNKVVPLTIFWPDTHAMRSVLPLEFRDCERTSYVADCFEVHVNLISDAVTEDTEIISSEDHLQNKCVLRYFITIAPHGTIILISKGRHQSVRYRNIVQGSGFLDHVQAGDSIILERELDIDCEIEARGATTKLSSAVKTRVFCETEDEGSRGLVHIKWVAHILKQRYQILDGEIPKDWVKTVDESSFTILDKIVQVASMLFNMTNKVWTYEKFFSLVKERQCS